MGNYKDIEQLIVEFDFEKTRLLMQALIIGSFKCLEKDMEGQNDNNKPNHGHIRLLGFISATKYAGLITDKEHDEYKEKADRLYFGEMYEEIFKE